MHSAHTLPSSHSAPPLSLLAMEPLRAVFDYFSSRLASQAVHVGDGHPVIVYPGLGGGAITTSHLRTFLKHSGFEAHDWGGGINTGPGGHIDPWLEGLVANVRAVQAASGGRKVSLVGWSLGGVYAREIAKRVPDAVRQVITLGTPFAMLGGGNHAGAVFKLLNGDSSQLTPELQARLRECPPVPTTSVFSKTDGIVSWRGCIEKRSERSESIEVGASHLGMGTHPEVLRVITDRLAQPEGKWRAMRRGSRLGRARARAA
ncbi:MAG: alpha/beta hydrolase [Burkholderiales bacterium]|nr:alpha/beta hydrolase [Burkholderiales bacterium]